MYSQLCSYENLELAFRRASKGKTTKQYVIDFEANLKNNLLLLQQELAFHIYKPRPLQMFILRDPKTRKINKSAFRDRIVHHAVCIMIEPLFEKQFIFDSYANRIGKGVLKAIKRYETFSRKVTYNFTRQGYTLKADIRKYFETVHHTILLDILHKQINDVRVMWLIKVILKNYCSKDDRTGMPLGNLTSQFFANVYLNELDQFVKHKLRAKCYIRYVDDFVILDTSYEKLTEYKCRIEKFLEGKLSLMLHPDKSRIISLEQGVEFLGMKIFPNHKLIKQKNLRKFKRKYAELCSDYEKREIKYDTLYDFLEGWCAYARYANSFRIRKKILQEIETQFPQAISSKEISRHSKWQKGKK
jgi:RNA-directed DNA polymerase